MNITFGGMFMILNRIFLMFTLMAMTASTVCAQSDDMYFVPKKEKKAKVEWKEPMTERPAYYVGSNRDVDEYNRRGRFFSSYIPVTADSLHSDVIDFSAGNGIYPDSLGLDTTQTVSRRGNDIPGDDEEEYRYCRRMQMFDGWYDPWFYGYSNFYGPYWGGWYDPWMYGYAGWNGYWGWNYYGYGWPYYSSAWFWGGYPYGWGYPYYAWSRPVIAYRPGHAGTLRYYDRSNYAGGTRIDRGNRRGYADGSYTGRRANSNIAIGRRRDSSYNNNGRMDNFDNVRSVQPSFGGSRPSGSFGGGSFGGSMGGSRGGGAGIGGGGVRMGRR